MDKINKRFVDQQQPESDRRYYWDSEIKGFGLLVLPTGVKSFIYQYRTPEGRTRRATIGKYSPDMLPEQARSQAKRLRRAVEDGKDPLAEKRAAREALTVAEVIEKYLSSAKFAEKAESTQAIDRGRIKRHLVPTLGRKFANKLTAEEVRRAFAAIRDGKTATDEKTKTRGRAIVRGGEGTARMAIRLLNSALNWAKTEGLVSRNPASDVKIGTDGTRDMILNPEHYIRLFRVLETMETERRIRSAVADAVRVIALTGARRGEIAGLIWKYVDLEAGTITLPPKAHKTGRATGKSRVIGLPAAAQAIIANQPSGNPDDYVFQPARGEGALNLSKPWRLIRDEAGLPEGIGLHGLRHSLASQMAVDGAGAAEIMATLGHHQLATAQKYIHWAQDARSKLAEKSAAHITAALNGKLKVAK
jgi:integrase